MKKTLLSCFLLIALCGCKKDKQTEPIINEDASTFAESGSFDVGGTGAAEISAFDPSTNRLFVVRNENEGLANQLNQIEVIDFSNPSAMKSIGSIAMLPFGGAVNSLSVSDGKLAAAIQSTDKQANGKVLVFKTSDYSKIAEITVGALPDMVTFSADGKYIISANEGEPNAAYTNDPSGTVSIISVSNNYAVTTLDFSSMESQLPALKLKGFRVFGPGLSFVKDIEPEYVTISADSKTAWVTLQENNAIAKIDIVSKTITNIFPLGFKNYNTDGNEIDPSDVDATYKPAKWNVKGMYLPDGIAVLEDNGNPYLFTANEGDSREYEGFTEMLRVKNSGIKLDATAFPDAATLKLDANLGRLNVTTTLGDTDGDGDMDELYSLGSRSFSVWNGNDGTQVFDSKNELDAKCVAAAVYDDGRSDDKSVEPEGITIGTVGSKKIAFVGMERADAVAVYDLSTPTKPMFLQLLKCGDAPEGVLFIPAKDSPTQKSLLVVSSEGDGVIKVYTPNTIL
ncbi:Alkaline phosphatase [Arcticibacter svalbardensis MN12-7]|uniref:Alkaline phosphatase n=1 Tax=Arcticibacter svalbardensis MN12-7 TaxID=1150600 RepID=R9GN87_9SPHI|nr:choice-of-anchor I family protein [Arcticibacter svalbardensis]EOR93307.1 Alkaline phosphatase [Arcticibacter svalbardensis MN12-7]